MNLEFTINDELVTIEISSDERLIDVLRNKLNLTSVKEGCSEGECGACTILLNNKAVTSCTMLAIQARGKSIVTVEGLAKNGELDEIQNSFIRNGAVQCGYCTPGMILSSKALLMENPNPTEYEIRRALEGNLCRCTGYTKIINSVKDLVCSK